MDSVESDESDGLDDADFVEQHENYLRQCEVRTAEILKREEERLQVSTQP